MKSKSINNKFITKLIFFFFWTNDLEKNIFSKININKKHLLMYDCQIIDNFTLIHSWTKPDFTCY